MSLKKIFDEIDVYNNSLKDIWKIDRRIIDLEEFLEDILDYFEVKDNFKEKYHEEFQYPHKDEDFFKQKNDMLNYIMFFLRHVKPFLLLAYKLSWNRNIENAMKGGKLSEEAIENMLYNFVNIYRHGRKPVYYPNDHEEFQEFKKKFNNVIDYYKEVDSFDGKTTGSIRDHARAMKKHGLTKKILSDYLFRMKSFIKNCSRATKYRFDKDVLLVEKSKWDIKNTLERFDFYESVLDKE